MLASEQMDQLAAAAAVPSFQDVTIVDLNNREISFKVSRFLPEAPPAPPRLALLPAQRSGAAADEWP